MLLGKRQRPPMKRTTSMSEMKLDLNLPGESEPSDAQIPSPLLDPRRKTVGAYGQTGQRVTAVDQRHGFSDQRLLATVSPRGIQRRHSADCSSDAAHFLRSCSLCKSQLVPSVDIYMYRGDKAFCSLECREQQMVKDEKKEKSAFAAKKESAVGKGAAAAAAAAATAGSGKGERVAAAV